MSQSLEHVDIPDLRALKIEHAKPGQFFQRIEILDPGVIKAKFVQTG